MPIMNRNFTADNRRSVYWWRTGICVCDQFRLLLPVKVSPGRRSADLNRCHSRRTALVNEIKWISVAGEYQQVCIYSLLLQETCSEIKRNILWLVNYYRCLIRNMGTGDVKKRRIWTYRRWRYMYCGEVTGRQPGYVIRSGTKEILYSRTKMRVTMKICLSNIQISDWINAGILNTCADSGTYFLSLCKPQCPVLSYQTGNAAVGARNQDAVTSHNVFPIQYLSDRK